METNSFDYLTGLYNRQALTNIYKELNKNTPFHVMFMDIDNFKAVNDVYGHNTGDSLLKSVALILRKCAPDAHAFRLGGDEFVLLFTQEADRDFLSGLADEIIRKIVKKEGFSHINTYVSTSIGILYNETKKSSLNDILLKSDMAMYHAKSNGKGCYVFFNDIADRMMSEIEMEKRQQYALDNGEFEIRYLPVISVQTSQLRISRVQLYWNMENGVIKTEEDFLPLFEKNGFIRYLDSWLINTIFAHLSNFHNNHKKVGKIAIRISRLTLLDSEFLETLKTLTDVFSVMPSELTFEIAETSFTRGSDQIIKALRNLKLEGFGVAITGVGSDFKSLMYWDKMMFDYISFAKEYLKTTLESSRGRQIIKTLLAMGRELKMQVMAEGIESKEDTIFLAGCGCNAISGPYYSDPIPMTRYFNYVKNLIECDDGKIEFHFLENFESSNRRYAGEVIGENVVFTKGIARNWGGVEFPGGSCAKNVLELPPAILAESSFTVCMWIKPYALNSWTSTFYARYKGSFCSFSPYVLGGNNIYRISEDADVNGFHDAISRQIPENTWSFITITYDDNLDLSRSYINGRKAGYCIDVPALPACRQILIGGDPFQHSFEGCISGLMFFSHVLSDEDIEQLYLEFCNSPGFNGTKEDFWMDIN